MMMTDEDDKLFSDTDDVDEVGTDDSGEERRAFIDACPIFAQWTPRFREMLDMSVQTEMFSHGSVLVRQGEPVKGLHFIMRGSGLVLMNVHRHRTQYPKLFEEAGKEISPECAQEFEQKAKEQRVSSLKKQNCVKKKEGYSATEKRSTQKTLKLCHVDQSEIVGAVELVLGLDTYSQTITCTADTDVFLVDHKNIDRLITKKYTHSLKILTEKVKEKIKCRLESGLGNQVELYFYLAVKLENMKPRGWETGVGGDEKPKMPVRPDMDRDTMIGQMVKLFLADRTPMIESCVPGSVYYVTKSREKAKKRLTASLRNAPTTTVSNEMRLQRIQKSASKRRQPRSRRALEKLTTSERNSEYSRTLRDEHNAVGRYLAKKPARPITAWSTGQSAESAVSTYSAAQRSSSESLDLQLDPNDFADADVDTESHVTLTTKDVESEVVRKVVMNMADLQHASNGNRARVICAMMEKKQKQNAGSLQKLLRPTSAPAPRRGRRRWNEESESDEDFDEQTSDTALKTLENKIRDFHEKYDREAGHKLNTHVQELRRFNVKAPEDVPVPGGTVLIRQRKSTLPSRGDNEGNIHSRIRRFIVPKDAYKIAAKSMSVFESRASSTLPGGVSNIKNNEVTQRQPRIQSAPPSRLKSGQYGR